MHYWHDIEPVTDGGFNAIIEIPAGSSTKFEYDKDYGIFRMDRVLYTSTHYPANYGFIPKTYAEDDDPLDILVLCRKELPTGTLVRARVIGVFHMVDEDSNDEKILAVAMDDPAFKDIMHVDQLPQHIIQQMTHFFEVYKALENKDTKVREFRDAPDANRIIDSCIERYKEKFSK